MQTLTKKTLHIAVAGALALGGQAAGAMVIDLATASGGSGTLNGATFTWIDAGAGTGNIDSFVQSSGAGNRDETHAFNTTVNNVLNNGSADPFNHSITVADVPRINLGGALFREFMLDINENAGRGAEYLSLDEVQIFIGGTANASFNTFGTDGVLQHDGALVYDMEGGAGNWVAMNFSLNAGSGTGDLFMYIPDSLFSAFGSTSTVTLYSHFGRQGVNPTGFTGNFHTSDGFEEWAVRVGVDFCDANPGDRLCNPTGVPEPGSLALLGLGLAGLGLVRRRAIA